MSYIFEAVIDIGSIFLRLFFFLCVAWVALSTAVQEWKNHRRKIAIPLFIITVGLIYPVYQSFADMAWPVVSSGKINLTKKDFKYDPKSKQYRVEFSNYGKIEDVDVFYTAYYDQNGIHNGRMTWTKYVDFRFDGDWIQSQHELNNAEGQHTIVFKYRTNLWKYAAAKRRAVESLTS